MLRSIPLVVFLFCTSVHWAQEEPSKELDEVLFSIAKKTDLSIITINQKRIENKLAPDIATILAQLPGLQIRTYGDVSGLKTVGFRSLGSGHSSIVVDYQNQPTTQSGSVDLSAFSSEFVRSVQIIRQDGTNTELPIQSKLAGGLIQIKTFHSDIYPKNRFAIGFQNGSFGYNSIDLTTTLKYKSLTFTAAGRARQYEGAFPYEYMNGYTEMRSTRQNNGLKDLIGNASLTWKINPRNTISFKGNYFTADKELAGAVVFYNENNQQYLFNDELNGNLWHKYASKRIELFTQFSLQNSKINYLDSNYLNSQGYLEQAFTTLYANAQSQLKYNCTDKVAVSIGSEASREEITEGTLASNPLRLTLNQFAAAQYKTLRHQVDFQLGAQFVDNLGLSERKQSWNYLPAIQYLYRHSNHFEVGLIGRYTVRQPTFSEMYYQQVGGSELKPEEASLASLPIKINTKWHKWFNAFRVEPFYTFANNKIVAMPTKNLFVWSIQNIGKSQSLGLEIYNESRIVLKKSTLGQVLNLTLQEAIDLTNPNGTTYRNQITYIPRISGTFELDWTKDNFNVFTLFSAQGMRYALPQNLSTNEVDAYYTIDIGASYKWQLKNHQVKVFGTLKNVTNQYNQYIKYFVLPGINYQVKLTYAI